MNCHSVRNVLDLRAEGRLSPGRAARVDAHLSTCKSCRTHAALLDRPKAPAAGGAPESLKKRLLAAIRAAAGSASAPPEPALPLWPSETPALALAAAGLVVVGLLVFAAGVPSQSSGSGLAAAAEEP